MVIPLRLSPSPPRQPVVALSHRSLGPTSIHLGRTLANTCDGGGEGELD